MDRHELPQLLQIDAAHAADGVRAAVAFDAVALAQLLGAARAAGVPLAIVSSQHSLTLFSTDGGHLRAFAPVLARLRERAQRVAGLGALRVRALRGSDVARWAVREACGFESRGPSDFLSAWRDAAAEAARAGTLSAELSELIELAQRARDRVHLETRFAGEHASADAVELELLAAERIVEEEIVEWQFSAPELRAASVRVPALSGFPSEEAESAVRLRSARVLDKLRVA
ncbi:MAG TPA: hypothetical protein VGI10_15640 [Polyangiaceae bacterium]|jgi:hypothetical protein